MAVFPWRIGFRDARGFVYYVAGYTSASGEAGANTNAQAIFTALANISNADAQISGGCLLGPRTAFAPGGSANYADGATRLVYAWQDGDGSTHRWRVPAPQTGLFEADGVTLNQTDALIVALNAAMATAVICSRAGIPYQLTLGGVRERGRQRRHLGLGTLAPSLATQG